VIRVKHVSVSVLTFRRNDDLAALLPQLLEHIEDARTAYGEEFSFEVLVVDNDPDGGAVAVTRPFDGTGLVRYVVEQQPGIAAARNRALDEARPDGIVVFIDDDERPSPGWLRLMLGTWREHRSAAVGGPVEAYFDGEIDPWIAAGGYFNRGFRSGFRTGSPVKVAPTGNILLDMARINAVSLRFDSSLGLSGGEDTLFTRQLVERGEQIIWCNEAEVKDPVPPARLTRRWVVSRVFFVSNSSINASLMLATSWFAAAKVRLRYGATGSARLVLGAGQTVAGTLGRDQRLQARGVGKAARGAGALAAVLGFRFEEYRR
jgi:succinoglycan biosynthesis protein ExoM